MSIKVGQRIPSFKLSDQNGSLRIPPSRQGRWTMVTEKLELKGTLEYQACDDRICYAPTKVPLVLPLEVEPLERQRVPEELRRKPPEE